MQEKLNKKHKNRKDSKFIISQTLILELHNIFNVCRLSLVTNNHRKSELEFSKRSVNARDL